MKRAAITGVTGQDGTLLTEWLQRQGCEVHGLLRQPFDREEPRLRRRFSAEAVSSIRWHNGSLEDPFSLVRFLKSSRLAEDVIADSTGPAGHPQSQFYRKPGGPPWHAGQDSRIV